MNVCICLHRLLSVSVRVHRFADVQFSVRFLPYPMCQAYNGMVLASPEIKYSEYYCIFAKPNLITIQEHNTQTRVLDTIEAIALL